MIYTAGPEESLKAYKLLDALRKGTSCTRVLLLLSCNLEDSGS